MEEPAFAEEVGDLAGLRILDLVVSRLALHYVDDLAPVFNRVHRALAPGGRLVFTVAHPVLTAARLQPSGPRSSLVVDDYFTPGSRTRQWFGRPVVWRHRTIEDCVAPLLDAGFTLAGLRECAPVEALFEGDTEELERRRRVPLFLLLSAVA